MEKEIKKDTEKVAEKPEKKKKGVGKIILIVVLVIFGILLLCGVGVYFLARNFVYDTLETIGIYTEEAERIEETFERVEEEMDDFYYDVEDVIEDEEEVVTIEWTQGEAFEDERDGQIYQTVNIGEQVWMQENLNIGEMVERDETEALGTSCDEIQKFCYEDNELNCDAFGGLYQWEQVMCGDNREGSQGICPDGWYVPTDDDWKALETYLGMRERDVESTGWRDYGSGDTGNSLRDNVDWNGSNASGFTALPVGFIRDSGSFAGLTRDAYFWTSSSFGQKAWYRALQSDYVSGVRRSNADADSLVGYSVRCIQK